jgi:5-formyltetrahydrofolate cyclo-ligase
VESLTKSDLRIKTKKMLKGLTLQEQDNKNALIQKKLKHFLATLHTQNEIANLGGFAPLKNEVNWVLDLMPEKLSLSFPVDHDSLEGFMVYRESSFEELIIKRSFGIEMMIPSPERRIVTPEVLLVPGLAFTKSGERLGRGKGFFDRYLESYEGTTIGICFSEQVVEEIPVNDLDQKVNFLINDLFIIDCKKNEEVQLKEI